MALLCVVLVGERGQSAHPLIHSALPTGPLQNQHAIRVSRGGSQAPGDGRRHSQCVLLSTVTCVGCGKMWDSSSPRMLTCLPRGRERGLLPGWPGQSQEPGASSRSPMWMQEHTHSGHLLLLPGTLAGSWVGSGASGTQTVNCKGS